MNKFENLIGNWIVKKRIKKDILVSGYCVIKNTSKYYYEFKENIKTNINNKLISGHQIFQISESKNNIYESLYFCKKDLYLSKLRIISKNFFTIYTKIRGPKKNLGILANYYRTI